MNTIILIGRLTRDVEFKQSQNGISLAKGTIAVDKKSKSEGADFFNFTAFKGTADFLNNYSSKGSKIAIKGSLSNSSYEKEGKKMTFTEIIVDSVELLDSKKKDGEEATVAAPAEKKDEFDWDFEV